MSKSLLNFFYVSGVAIFAIFWVASSTVSNSWGWFAACCFPILAYLYASFAARRVADAPAFAALMVAGAQMLIVVAIAMLRLVKVLVYFGGQLSIDFPFWAFVLPIVLVILFYVSVRNVYRKASTANVLAEMLLGTAIGAELAWGWPHPM